jgi:hypothetical protein
MEGLIYRYHETIRVIFSNRSFGGNWISTKSLDLGAHQNQKMGIPWHNSWVTSGIVEEQF